MPIVTPQQTGTRQPCTISFCQGMSWLIQNFPRESKGLTFKSFPMQVTHWYLPKLKDCEWMPASHWRWVRIFPNAATLRITARARVRSAILNRRSVLTKKHTWKLSVTGENFTAQSTKSERGYPQRYDGSPQDISTHRRKSGIGTIAQHLSTSRSWTDSQLHIHTTSSFDHTTPTSMFTVECTGARFCVPRFWKTSASNS